MLGLILALILVLVSVNWFAHELESVSASRAKADPDNPKRSLKLGLVGRGILAIIPVVIVLILALISKFEVAATIILLVLNVIIFVAHFWLRLQGFATFWSCFLIIWANNIAGMMQSQALITNPSAWMIVWSGIISVLNITMIIVHLVFKFKKPREKDEGDEEYEFDYVKIIKIILVVILLVAMFIVGYTMTNSFIVPLFS